MITQIQSTIIFTGYKNILKTEWKKGNLPTVKYGFYGDRLTQDNLSLEHLNPHSKGGETIISNLVLASKDKNNARGNQDIINFAERKTVADYLLQFMGVKIKKFSGDKYIQDIINSLAQLGFTL